ncbi:hypothetical protein DEU56DRAFT_955912 [Suillus clintonianus]|uniref:uncharacterized protein n=1 Tax=Suillus clintonianus TaxID=1904413 RepID=UPI001B8864D9|nr:uncharacterized protein DEU56DRAFT_955912 [Suillus clintonianus]KAG2130233.1 hypothetical protein DEU56DRAFT_955912 [Suillus clintonianus]
MSTDPPENSQNTKQTRPKRNAVTFRSSKRSIPELISDPSNTSEIIDEQSARTVLESRLFITPAAEITIDTLTTALLDFTVQAPSLTPMHIDIIRAIAILLFKTDHNQKAKTISDAISKQLEEPLTRLNKLANTNIQENANLDAINETMKKAEASIDKITNTIEEIKNTIEQITPTINTAQNGTTNTTNIETSLEKIQQEVTTLVKESVHKNGYKTALLSGLDNNANDHTTQIAARDAIKARQILINVTLDGPIAPSKVSHAQLVEKIQTAISSLDDADKPILVIKNINQYRNGGTVIEMTTAEAAEFLKKNTVKEELIKKLDPKAVFKDRGYPVVIQFVPLTYDPDNQNHIRELEAENNWEEGTITLARWIKPPNKRNEQQRVAHLLIILKNPNNANEGIRNGITLENARPTKTSALTALKNTGLVNATNDISANASHAKRKAMPAGNAAAQNSKGDARTWTEDTPRIPCRSSLQRNPGPKYQPLRDQPTPSKLNNEIQTPTPTPAPIAIKIH